MVRHTYHLILHYHNLIPEGVYNYTSASFNKKKKSYNIFFGNYLYQDVPVSVYHYGILLINDGEYNIQIATKEKALADKLYTLSPLKNVKEITELLLNDLRIDLEDLKKLNINDMKIISDSYKCMNVTLMYKFLRKVIKDENNNCSNH